MLNARHLVGLARVDERHPPVVVDHADRYLDVQSGVRPAGGDEEHVAALLDELERRRRGGGERRILLLEPLRGGAPREARGGGRQEEPPLAAVGEQVDGVAVMPRSSAISRTTLS